MNTGRRLSMIGIALLTVVVLALGALDSTVAKKKKKSDAKPEEDPYAEYVWPPPPDKARIKLERVIMGRADVEARSKFRRKLMGMSPQNPYDSLKKPFAVAFDTEGRILVTDSSNGSLHRFDLENRVMDVLGTHGMMRLKLPLGLDVSPEGTIYVADGGLGKVVAFDPEGKLVSVYGQRGELENPTDAALSPDGSALFVADSKAHRIAIFDVDSGALRSFFGRRGGGDGEFNFPTSLAFDPEGNLYVVDQINARIQIFDGENEYVDEFGKRGVDFSNFVRPKDVAVDEVGFIYVTDHALNNVQIFDADLSLLTFVGEGGFAPGRFYGASGVAVQGDRLAVVDQLGRRIQLFRFIVPKDE